MLSRSELEKWKMSRVHNADDFSDDFPVERHPDFIPVLTGCTFGNSAYLGRTFSTATEEESDLNYETRSLLESVCASVENVAEDFSADVAMMADLEESL